LPFRKVKGLPRVIFLPRPYVKNGDQSPWTFVKQWDSDPQASTHELENGPNSV